MSFSRLVIAAAVATVFVVCARGEARGSDKRLPVSPEEAAGTVKRWLGRRHERGAKFKCRLGARPRKVETFKGEADKGEFHIVTLDGGGFAAVSGSSGNAKVVAFSQSSEFKATDENPLYVLLKQDAAGRAEGAAAGKVSKRASAGAGNGLESIDDPRIDPLVKSKWGQKYANDDNGEYVPCYNYYTYFDNLDYPCGCVATMGAQIMRYHCWPTQEVEQVEYYTGIDGLVCDPWLSTIGGIYDWSKMPLDPAGELNITDEQCEAIGRLTYDVGVACTMFYGIEESSAPVYMFHECLIDLFHYANADCIVFTTKGTEPKYNNDSTLGYSLDLLKRAVVPSLDARLPVGLHVGLWNKGHAVVADGYGYMDGAFYLHINMGWSGGSDAWYAPPDIGDYNCIAIVVYNINPESGAGASIVSGRILRAGGEPVAGATVSATAVSGSVAGVAATTDGRGIYALALQPGDWRVTVSENGCEFATNVTVAACASISSYYNDEFDEYGCWSEEVADVSQNIGNLYDVNLEIDYDTAELKAFLAWLEEYGFASDGATTRDAASVKHSGTCASGKECTLWADFVAGTCPTNAGDVFIAKIDMVDFGGVRVPEITWEPDTPELRATRNYAIYGQKKLGGEWEDVTGKTPAQLAADGFGFFKVVVELKQ
ncbi:MAG: C10 family peptidase [Kiritimatiellae bacterium]|nr:C10 family peptidase [Kiritimatiellia bacterium]